MKKVNRLLGNNFINERLDQIDQLTQCIESFLDITLTNRVWPLLRKRRLLLLTDDPHLATQARFIQKPLCNHINNQLQLQIKGVDIKLMSLPLASNKRFLNRKKMSPETADVLRSIAAGIVDEDLQGVLERVANSDSKTAPEH